MFIRLSVLIAILFSVAPVAAQEREGDYLYQVTTIRAEPGKLEDLINWTKAMTESGYFDDAGSLVPMIMRHSQGDQWDLMKIAPMGSWSEYHAKRKSKKRARAASDHSEKLTSGRSLVAFEEDHFAYGPPLEDIQKAYADNSFYHIEMFSAVAGKESTLFEQRRMENTYLTITGQTPNMIFHRAGGSDIDVFTIGFHKSLTAFAAPAPVTIAEKEEAAKAAGFKDLADISYYLRSLISGHHDTLAVKVE